MTDQELIQLLNEKPASEFTAEELEALRTRWTQSAELRQALVQHLHLETQLSGALGNIDLDINAILKRAADQRRRSPLGQRNAWQLSIGLSLFVMIGLVSLVWFVRAKQPVEIAHADPSTSLPQEGGVTANESAAMQEKTAEPKAGETSADAAVAAVDANSKTESAEGTNASSVRPNARVEVPAADEPWSKSLSRDVAPWPANSPKLTRDFKAAGHDELSESEARRWFSQVEGQPYTWGQDTYGANQRRAARFQGLARLRAPWPDTALLRLTPFDVNDLTIYLWRGPTGIALRLYTRREPHLWAAYEIVRENSSPKPLRWGLLTTDNCSYARAGIGTFDLCYQDGGITLGKGGIPLMTAPLAGRPDEVFFEGQFRLRGISMNKSSPMISVSENPHPLIDGGPANELPWVLSAETPAQIGSNPDGSATFRTDSRDKLGTVILPLAERGLYEVIVRVDAAEPGTGVFLGDLDGRPVHRLGFFKDAATGRTTIGILRPGENRDQSNFDFNAFPCPYHTPAQWIKVVAGLGTVQVLVSGDGRHWGHLVENPGRDLPGAVGSVGLFGLPGPAARTLKLARLEVRELSGLSGLADQKLTPQVPQFTAEEWKDATRWTHRVVDSHPAGVDVSRWFTSCGIAALTQGPPREFGPAMLKRLVTLAVHSNIPLRQKLLVLDEAAVLSDLWDEAAARPFAELYEALGEQMFATADHHPLNTIRAAVFRTPMWTVSKLRFAWERLNSRELLATVFRGEWTDAWNLAQSTTFWNSMPHPDWVPVERADLLIKQARWASAVAVENAPQLEDGQSGILPAGWRHPLALQWNKEAYNVRAELQSALTSQTYEDACRIVTSINVSDGPGLLPDMDDRQLFVSLPTAVAGAMQAYPQFARLMSEKFGPLGIIRVRQAIQSGDVRGVQSATLQFYGTEASAEAHQWLGDRDLSAGSFSSAEEHFLLALTHALPRQRDALQSRLQLAMALNGKPSSSGAGASTTPIELNGRTISPNELNSLLVSLTARPSPTKRFHHELSVSTPSLAPLSLKAETRATFDGQPGLNPGRHEYRFGDPFGRQLAVVADPYRMYISNRFQVNAFALPGGQQQWAQGLGSEQGEAYAMPFTPMTPLVAGDRLFVRRMTKAGAELACMHAESGKVLWTQRPNLHVLSDPVFWNGSLFALNLARIDDDLVQVEGTRFDFETGAPTSSQALFRLKDSGDRSFAAQLTVSGRLAVCSLNGITACFNGSGEVQWLRRHVWLPKAVDELNDDCRVAAPYVQRNRVIVSVPGVRNVSCVDLETGRQYWERPLPDLKGALDVRGNRVLVETSAGVLALDSGDGSVAWTRPFETRLEAIHVDDHSVILSRRITVAQNVSRPCLVWLDLDSGRELAQSQVTGADRNESQLGPIFFASGKWWGLLGQGWKEAKRELVEFVPMSPLAPGPFALSPWTSWSTETIDTQLADLALVMPGWRPEASYGPRLQLIATDVRGESLVESIKLEPAHEVRLMQVIDIPAGRKTLLQMRYGNAQNQRWSLVVRASGKTVFEQLVEEAGSVNGWRDTTVDLAPFAGEKVLLQLIQSVPAQQPATEAYWKRAAIIVE